MASSLIAKPSPSGSDWPRVRVHPGTGLIDRRGDVLVVVPVLAPVHSERVRELIDFCHRPEPPGRGRIDGLRALLDAPSAAELPGLAVLVRSGAALHALVHGPVQVLLDGRRPEVSGSGRGAEHVLADGAWHRLTVAAESEQPPSDVDDLVVPLDLGSGTVPGAGVTLMPVTAEQARPPMAAESASSATTRPETSMTALRPAVQFRTVLLGECAVAPSAPVARRPPLPIAGAPGGDVAGVGTANPEVLVEGVLCPEGHFTDPDLSSCPTCGAPLASDGSRVTRPRPPCGILVTDGGTIYTVTGDVVIGREAEGAPDVLAGRARPLPLRDAARSTSRVHARLTVRGWKVLLSDNGSANGTFLSSSGAAGPWLRVAPEAPVPLVHGDRVRLGRRQLLFDTWRETVVPQVFR